MVQTAEASDFFSSSPSSSVHEKRRWQKKAPPFRAWNWTEPTNKAATTTFRETMTVSGCQSNPTFKTSRGWGEREREPGMRQRARPNGL